MTDLPAASLERAMHPDVQVGRGILGSLVSGLDGRIALLTQPGPYAVLPSGVTGRASATVMVDSLAAEDLEALVRDLPPVDIVLGLGGGMTLDAAKYVAWRRSIRLILAPSVISVDASVTNTIAVRRGGSVVYEGFVVADPIVADLELISAAPPRLNRAGVGDLLSIHTALADWRLGARAGRIAFEPDVAERSAAVLEKLFGLGEDVSGTKDAAMEAILRSYVTVNALCLTVGHSGPEEGSEHYFGYRLEAVTGRSFVHGELIGLGTVLMARLQGNEPERVIRFLDTCQVAWRPPDQSLDRATLVEALGGLQRFVREADLPYSIIDAAALSGSEVSSILDGLV
jgi:glycerol-1-phosphate dehydrogenase [NAD(P)+]